MNDQTPGQDAGPLERQLRAAAARSRQSLSQTEFSRDDYQHMLDRAGALEKTLKDRGLGEQALSVLHKQAGVLKAVVRLLDDPQARVAPPSNDQVYGAALIIARLDRAAGDLAGAAGAWFERIDRLLAGDLEPGGEDPDVQLALVEFGGLCRRSGISCKPRGTSSALLEVDDWTLTAAAGVTRDFADLTACASRACGTLVSLKRPGLIVLDISAALPDDQALHRVANDATAMIEMRRHIDQFIVDRHEDLVGAVDTDFAFGAVLSAVMQSLNVSNGRMAFASCSRAVNLCEPDDPRAARLGAFMNRLS